MGLMTEDNAPIDQPIREDKYCSVSHPDVVIITRVYKDGHTTIDLEGDNHESLSAVETELKVVLMRKGMLGKLSDRNEVER